MRIVFDCLKEWVIWLIIIVIYLVLIDVYPAFFLDRWMLQKLISIWPIFRSNFEHESYHLSQILGVESRDGTEFSLLHFTVQTLEV